MPGSGSEVLLQEFSERQSDKWGGGGGFARIQREAPILQGTGREMGPWLGFASRVNSYANEQEDHPSLWGTTPSSVF